MRTLQNVGQTRLLVAFMNLSKIFHERDLRNLDFGRTTVAGQNKNRIIFSLYTHAAREFGVTIIHRFLEKGHTQNEGDSVHSVIERAGEHKLIYTPEEWKILIRWAKSENPYEVRDLTQDMVYDFKNLLKNKNLTKNTVNEKVSWAKIKEIYETRNRAFILKKAYFEPIAISKDKYRDLMNLCETGIIPTKYHEFFKTLTHGQTVISETDDDSE
ncbi:hypothetical protein ACJJTC_010426 [Scirpophaga incertulas]